jgi:subtilase family serine protease
VAHIPHRLSWVLAFESIALGTLIAQQIHLPAPIDDRRTVLSGGAVTWDDPRIRSGDDLGPANPSLRLGLVTLILRPAPAQLAALEHLLAEQQNPSLPNYHRWLSPLEFADRFGTGPEDLARVRAWLVRQGLAIEHVAGSRNWIAFSGTAGEIDRALHTGFHQYRVGGRLHFANTAAPSIPADLEEVVSGFWGLDDFHLEPPRRLRPAFTASNADHYLAPDDLAVIYDIAPLYQLGIDGSGQKIAIVGQTGIDLADTRKFRAMFHLPDRDPQIVLFGPDPGITSDIAEANVDLQWAGAVARNADLVYVYSQDVMTAVRYAISQNLAPVISMSYAGCEQLMAGGSPSALRLLAQQANAQGITWIASSGDNGAAGCDAVGSPAATNGLTVNLPASLPKVTAVGGTQFDDTAVLWSPTNGPDYLSALSYLPERAWNSSSPGNGIQASGGGASMFYAKPWWQAGPGVPGDGARDVPDVALAASPDHDPYLIELGGALMLYGGSSASAPVFAGMVALLNQYLDPRGVQSQPGLGNINPTLYQLAQTTPGAFHDIAAGDNLVPCVASTLDCPDSAGSAHSQIGYSASPGYDMVTGLGSVDAFELVSKWSPRSASAAMTLNADPGTITLNDAVRLSASVKGSDGASTPAGSVDFYLGGLWLGTVALSGSAGTASAILTVSGGQFPVGNDIVTAYYGGDAAFNASSASVAITAVLPLMAGVATTLTDFTINGTSRASEIPNLSGSAAIPAGGTASASLRTNQVSPPAAVVLGFTGVDADGGLWSQQMVVPFYKQPFVVGLLQARKPPL